MRFFHRHDRRDLLPVHTDNVRNTDWVILLEANTIVGGSGERLRVAQAGQAREIIRKGWPFRPRFFLYVKGYNPRIHFVVFCPQLYKYDHAGHLLPLRGIEIGQFIARALDDKATPRTPWYALSSGPSDQPIINESLLTEYDTLLAEPTLVPQIQRRALESHVDLEKLERTLTDGVPELVQSPAAHRNGRQL
jgi:hypothetical protein